LSCWVGGGIGRCRRVLGGGGVRGTRGEGGVVVAGGLRRGGSAAETREAIRLASVLRRTRIPSQAIAMKGRYSLQKRPRRSLRLPGARHGKASRSDFTRF
jgi:hypothetical protein